MKRRNLLGLAAVVVALTGLSIWALAPRPASVELADVTQGVFEQAVSDDGKTRVRERYVVSAPLAGRVERIRLKAGDPVERGQPIALLAPTAPSLLDARTARELQERVGSAEAQQLRAKAEIGKALALRDQANADLQRQERLAKGGFVSSAAREQAELALRTAESSVEAARFAEDAAGHELRQARAALARYKSGEAGSRWEVSAPVKGVVLKVLQESEGAVPLGAPLVEIADPRSLEAVVDVLSQESVALRPGMAARVELGQGVPPLAARVRRIEPAAFTKISALGVEEQRVNVVLELADSLERIETLGDGFRVEAHIVTRRLERAVKVPVGAVFRDADGWSTFIAREGRAVKRPLTLAARNAAEAAVEKGLSPGEKVIVYPSDLLRDGDRIEARR
jgi:HlyD family secretion protein